MRDTWVQISCEIVKFSAEDLCSSAGKKTAWVWAAKSLKDLFWGAKLELDSKAGTSSFWTAKLKHPLYWVAKLKTSFFWAAKLNIPHPEAARLVLYMYIWYIPRQ